MTGSNGLAWKLLGACSTHPNPELWWPTKTGHTKAFSGCTLACVPCQAIRVCSGCQVRAECLRYALTIEADAERGRHGIWGGLTARERGALVRRKGIRVLLTRREATDLQGVAS